MTLQNYSFGDMNMSAVNTSAALKPWGIYDVTFDGISKEEMKGKKDPNASYNTLKISFSNSEGKFSKNLFIPSKPEDYERNERDNKEGHKYQTPSHWEEFKWQLLQLVQVLSPSGIETIQKQSSKFKSPEDYVKLVIDILTKAKGTKTKLKLTGRNSNGNIYADIPRITAVNHDNDLFICNSFVGDRVAWSSYEAGQKALYESAKPTSMESAETKGIDLPDNTEDTSDIDFDSLAADL